MPHEMITGIWRNVAIVLDSLDDPAAETLLAQLPPWQAEQARRAQAALGPISTAERQRVLAAFLQTDVPTASAELAREPPPDEHRVCPDPPPNVPAPPETAAAQPFAFLNQTSAEALAARLAGEHPQTASLVLVHLQPSHAAAVLRRLPSETRTEVLCRLARLDEMDARVVADLERQLEHTFAVVAPRPEQLPSGARAVEAILQAVDGPERSALLDALGPQNATLVQQLGFGTGSRGAASPGSRAAAAPRRSAAPRPSEQTVPGDASAGAVDDVPVAESEASDEIEFNDLAGLDELSLAKLFQTAQPEVILLALTGASPGFAERVLQRLPPRDARVLRRQMESLGPIRLRDVEYAQRQLAVLAQQLAAAGAIEVPASRRFTVAA
jgi:flagellar motor switch protein FliG